MSSECQEIEFPQAICMPWMHNFLQQKWRFSVTDVARESTLHYIP